jgi:ribonuclease P protein component
MTAASAQHSDATRQPGGVGLRKRAQFLAVQKQGAKAIGAGFVLQAARLPEHAAAPDWHYGLTASKKVGNAVARNRAKRRLRALVRGLMPDLARPQMAYIFIARQALAGQSWQQMQQELVRLTGKLHRQLEQKGPPA